MEIVVLVDNRVESGRGLLGAHGFSAYLELFGKRVLFDTGQGRELAVNAAVLGVDLEGLDALVLSHGHYDHTGGMRYVGKTKLFYHPSFFGFQYKGDRYIGPGVLEASLSTMGFEPEIVEGVRDLGGFYAVNMVDSYNDFEYPTLSDGLPEPFFYEISLVVPSGKGFFVVTGCSHRGICNIVEHVERILGGRVFCVLGGLHLFDAPSYVLEKTASFLRERGVYVYGCHCTGERGALYLSEAMDDLFSWGYVGMRLKIEEVGNG